MKDYFCAYHNTQFITNFCKCSQCLLPVCPTCIRLHSEEHSLLKTQPDYEHIEEVFKSVKNDLVSFEMGAKKLSTKLIQIEEVRKQNETFVKRKIIQHRKKLIRQFERCLLKLQEQMINSIVRDDQNFIEELETIDEKVISLERKLQKERKSLEQENSLKMIIDYYSNDKKQSIGDAIHNIDRQISQIVGRTLFVCIDEGYLDELERAIQGYMSLRLNDMEG